MSSEKQIANGANGNASSERRILHVHHIQFILMADKRRYNEAGH